MGDSPRERLREKGVRALSDSELLAILLRTGSKGFGVGDLSRKVLREYSLVELSRLSVEELEQFRGISFAKATTLVSAFELVRRVGDTKAQKVFFTQSKDVVEYVKSFFIGVGYERVVGVFVTTKNGVIRAEIMHEGSIDYSIIEPRKLVKRALELQASGFFILHNHPSGDPTPSQEDKRVTQKMKEVCDVMGLRFLDHIIYGDERRYYSFFDDDNI